MLFTPELEMAKDWIENDNNNVNWAKKYKFNYQNTSEYIDKYSLSSIEQRAGGNRLKRKKKPQD